MSFFKSSKRAEDVKQGGSSHINASGFYPVTILAPVVSVGAKGSTSVDFFLESNGQKQIIYGNLRTTNNNDAEGNEVPNKIGAKIFNQLMIIGDLDELDDPVEVDLPIGPKESMKTVAAIEEMADMEAIMRIQMEYGIYKGNITEKKVIKAFFRADKASAEEIVNESDIGTAYEKEMKYKDNVTYKDEITPEQVTAWIAAKRPKGTGGAGDTSTQTSKAKPGFGEKRAFGSKKKAADE